MFKQKSFNTFRNPFLTDLATAVSIVYGVGGYVYPGHPIILAVLTVLVLIYLRTR